MVMTGVKTLKRWGLWLFLNMCEEFRVIYYNSEMQKICSYWYHDIGFSSEKKKQYYITPWWICWPSIDRFLYATVAMVAGWIRFMTFLNLSLPDLTSCCKRSNEAEMTVTITFKQYGELWGVTCLWGYASMFVSLFPKEDTMYVSGLGLNQCVYLWRERVWWSMLSP